MALIRLDEPTTRRIDPKRFALFALGFRPFYLLAAVFAAVAIPAWALMLAGMPGTAWPGAWWHAHEMLFGFAVAVIVGFLFTAGKVWTGLATPTGLALQGLASLWLAGRIAMASGGGLLVAIVDCAFLFVCAAVFMRLLLKARSHRNYGIGVLMLVLACTNLAFHLAAGGVLRVDPLQVMLLAVVLVVTLETVMAGRVVPMFTANALRGVKQWRRAWLDRAAIMLTLAALTTWVVHPGTPAALLASAAGALQLVRSLGWNPLATWRNPLLWVLHLSHLWIPAGLALAAMSVWGWVPRSAAVHALTIGSMAGLIIGMITRTALGHTGRMLQAGPVETACYVLVHLAALTRVATLTLLPAFASAGVHLASTAWTLAFVLYLWRYVPVLSRARADGRPD